MRILKKASQFLLASTLLCFSSALHAQASKCYPVNFDNYDEIASEIIHDFSTNHTLIPKGDIENILLAELSGFINPDLLPPSPILTGNFAPTILFRWDSLPGRIQPEFVSNAYNLELLNRKITGEPSAVHGAQFILPAQEYHNIWLYSFYSTEFGSRSTLHVIVVDIIIIDKDVSYTCADIPTKRLSAPPTPGLHISPNPFHDLVHLQVDLSAAGTTSIEIYDLTGKLVRQVLAPQKLARGKHQFAFNWDQLPAGTYTCLLRGPQRSDAQLLIKARD